MNCQKMILLKQEEEDEITIKEEPFLTEFLEEIDADGPSSTGNCEFEVKEEQEEEFPFDFAFENCLLNKSAVVQSEEENSDADKLEVDPLAIKQEPEPLEKVEKDIEEQHRVIDSEKRPFRCEICSKTFRLESQLEEHVKSRHGEKSFVCELCAKSFISKKVLKQHKAIHSKERPYFGCGVCLKKFSRKSYLNLHVQIHKREKPFVCDSCANSFATNQVLKRHQAIHCEKRPKILLVVY